MAKEKKLDIKKIEAMRHEVLQQICDDLNEDLVASAIRTAEDIGVEGAPEMLTVIFDEIGLSHDDALGEFYFYPVGTDEDVTGFLSCVITLSEELQTEHLDKLYEALSVLNFHILSGSFGVSADRKFLSYKLCVPYPLSMGKDELYDFVNIVTGNAVTMADQWADMVLRIAEGEGSVDDVTDALGSE